MQNLDKEAVEKIENIILFKRRGSEPRLILEALAKLGYRKQPFSPPPVLSDEELDNLPAVGGYPPTFKDLADFFRISKRQVAQAQIDLLKKKGYL